MLKIVGYILVYMHINGGDIREVCYGRTYCNEHVQFKESETCEKEAKRLNVTSSKIWYECKAIVEKTND